MSYSVIKSEKQFFDARQNIKEQDRKVVSVRGLESGEFVYKQATKTPYIKATSDEVAAVLVDKDGRLLAVKTRMKKNFTKDKKYRVWRMQRPLVNWKGA